MRKNIIRFLSSLFLFGILFLLSKTDSYALTYYTNPETGYRVEIEDDANLLSSEAKSKLAQTMEEITAYGNVAFVSTNNNLSSTSSFAKSCYRELFGTKSGTLFLIDMDNREIYIFSDGKVYRTITNSYALTITDNVFRYASAGQYYDCARQAFRQIATLLEGGRIMQPMKYISNALLSLLLGLLICFAWICIATRLRDPKDREFMRRVIKHVSFTPPKAVCTHTTKTYSPSSSDSGGGSSGGGGGGSSGGGGGHSF